MKPHKNINSLDVLRGLACLLVWLSHVRVTTRYFEDSRFDFIQVFSAWGRESVVVFFMLSGIVINLSSQDKTDTGQYFTKRFIRIYPIYLAVLLICFLCDHLIFGNPIDSRTLIGNLLVSGTLQVNFVPTMPLNLVVWSITCEVFFYIIFGLVYTLNKIKYVWIWLTICCLSIIYKISSGENLYIGMTGHFIYLLNISFVWILGYLVFEYRDKFCANLPVALCGILLIPLLTRLHRLSSDIHELMYSFAGICLIPLFIYLLRDYKTGNKERLNINHAYVAPAYIIGVILLWQHSNSLTISKILYSLLPFTSFILYYKPVTVAVKRIYHHSKSFLGFFANISYPIYLVHAPVMFIIYHFLPDQKVIGTLLIIFLTISISYLFEIYLFKKPARLLNAYRSARSVRIKQVPL
ncbi:acyltransferase [Pedobacter heparinus]|uniref:acyltransferase family protein n=1 Tax=Pedobacter heparinus TaxID=984 RepID=UPI0029313BF0|nr:acyltransferase [Pedobacter heparinus]